MIKQARRFTIKVVIKLVRLVASRIIAAPGVDDEDRQLAEQVLDDINETWK